MEVGDQDMFLLDFEGNPISGVLSLRVVRAEISNSDVYGPTHNFFANISLRNFSRNTSVSNKERNAVTWDQLFHFPVAVEEDSRHPFNIVKFSVVAFKNQTYSDTECIGSVCVHLHDVLRNAPSRTSLTLLNKIRVVGNMEIEIFFTYGLYGYGYSKLLSTSAHDLEDTVPLSHSIFPKVHGSTLDQRTVVKHPKFLAKQDCVTLSTTTWEQPISPLNKASEGEISNDQQEEDVDAPNFPLLYAQMTRLKVMQNKLRNLGNEKRLQKLGMLCKHVTKVDRKIEPANEMNEEVTINSAFAQFLKPTQRFLDGSIDQVQDTEFGAAINGKK